MKDKDYKNNHNLHPGPDNNKLGIPWDKIKVLFESAGEGVLITDIKTKKFVYANNAIAKMLGYRVEELEGMGLNQIHPEKDIEHATSEFEAQANGKKILAKNIPCLRKDGSIFYSNIHSIPALVDGRSCIFCLIADITEQKNAEAELQEYRDNLEVSVQERTAELADEIHERKRIAKSLDEKNIALREILTQLEIEKKVVRDNIMNNVTMMILPVINDLRQMGNSIDGKYLDLLEGHLKQLTSSFGTKITDLQFKLTIREMRICDLIKGGLTSKDIGKLLNISPKTVEGFRTSIRKKLGVKNTQINLQNFLQNL
jgi:PAS domain S-box-containing protein